MSIPGLESPAHLRGVAQQIGYKGGLPSDGVMILAQYVVDLQRKIAALETRVMVLEQSQRDTSAVPPHMQLMAQAWQR